MNKKKLLAGPYLFWALAFILIPLAMIVYYGLTDANGHLTFENLLEKRPMLNLKGFPAFDPALFKTFCFCQYILNFTFYAVRLL